MRLLILVRTDWRERDSIPIGPTYLDIGEMGTERGSRVAECTAMLLAMGSETGTIRFFLGMVGEIGGFKIS